MNKWRKRARKWRKQRNSARRVAIYWLQGREALLAWQRRAREEALRFADRGFIGYADLILAIEGDEAKEET